MTALPDLSSVKDVLVVDDDPVMLDVAEVMLERLGVTGIHTVLDGHAGLQRLAELGESCNLSICDLDMPGIDGIEFMRRVVDLGWHGGMIFVSGTDKRLLDVVKAIGRARAIGGLETLTKPLDPEKLAAAARRVTSKPMQRRTAGDDPMVTPADLEAALANGELVLEYQPKIEVASERVVGCEALVRWSHPSIGRIGPQVFIPLAEQCGLIGRVTEYVVQQAMSDVAEWSKWTSLNLAINVSMQDLQDLSWPDWLTDVAERHGVSTGQVTLEVTETSAFANLANSLEILARCRLRGFGLSIDDFGTGFSSLEKLSYVPFTELKIDRRFVQDSGVSSRAILQTSIELARELAMTTVAEGVETDEQLELVRGLGCNLVQGFLFARPMCAADFSGWYSARQNNTTWPPVIDQTGTRGDASW